MEGHDALLKRLEDYDLDNPNSTFPFSAKLAKETGWTPSFTQRAIEEYKRFCYLAMTAGHPVSPSEVIDEVWHMHLIYSHEYWKVFCPQVLQREFHHYPSTGGRVEKDKFEDWFAKTLKSYREAFGEDPPKDIWLDAPSKPVAPTTELVDIANHWVIPKHFLRHWGRLVGIGVTLLLVVGCASAIGNPLDYRGPEFLQFYVFLFAATLTLGLIARSMFRLPWSGSLDENSYPGPYSIAYLNGKGILAVNTAITSLLHRKVIELDIRRRSLKVIQPGYQAFDELEATIIRSASRAGGIQISMLRRNCVSILEHMHQDLTDRRLLVNETQGWIARLSGFVIAMLAPAYGLMKIEVGISRGRPVSNLEFLCVVSVIISFFLLIRPFRSWYGDRFLASIRNQQNRLSRINRRLDQWDPNDIALGMAIFGAGALYGSSLETQVRHLNPPAGTSSCGGGTYTSNSSSCSSGGSSCGSGCGGGGGGGCGGGGCGGCGS